LPEIDERAIRTTRERLHMSRAAVAHRLGVNPRTLERWERGRSKPNDPSGGVDSARAEVPGHVSRLEALAAAG
jgi:putative transcriptional regulator